MCSCPIDIEKRKAVLPKAFEMPYGKPAAEPANAAKYPAYFKPVGHLTHVDVYAVHQLFGINDPSGAIQHASKKLLLSGVRTGGKTAYDDVREARDTLNRYLEMHDAMAKKPV